MTDERKPILEIKGLCKDFIIEDGRKLTACQDISLPLYPGQTLGVVGESGCGKSTLVRTALQLEAATKGQVLYKGQDLLQLKGKDLRDSRRHIQMIFQNPTTAFNETMLVRDIVTEPLRNFHMLDSKDVDIKAKELLNLVGLPDSFLYRYPHAMSGGQRQRLGIARAISLEPEILICDEVTSALDVSVQDRICQLLAKLQKEKGMSFLFICHDLALVDLIAHQIAVMYLGHVVEYIDGKGFNRDTVRHPYTKALLDAVFPVDGDFQGQSKLLSGDIPSPLDVPLGCPFASRCTCCQDRCLQEKPPLVEIQPGHKVACHYV